MMNTGPFGKGTVDEGSQNVRIYRPHEPHGDTALSKMVCELDDDVNVGVDLPSCYNFVIRDVN